MEIYSEKSIFHIIILIILSYFNECANGLPKLFRTNEICGLYNGHRVYLELGDRGQLRATNITIANVRDFSFERENNWIIFSIVCVVI